MPPLPSAPKVIKLVLHVGEGEDANSLNRFFFQYTGTAPTHSDLDTFCTAVGTHWNTRLGPFYDNSSGLLRTDAEDLSSPTSAVGEDVNTHIGTRAGDRLQAATSAVISAAIARRYRGGHPRSYLAVGTFPDLADRQTWTSTFVNALQTAFVLFINDITTSVWAGGGTLGPVNVSYFNGFHNFTFPSGRTRPIPTLRAAPVIDAITDYFVRTKLGSQRRRNLQSS